MNCQVVSISCKKCVWVGYDKLLFHNQFPKFKMIYRHKTFIKNHIIIIIVIIIIIFIFLFSHQAAGYSV
jgi:hypothetical protein